MHTCLSYDHISLSRMRNETVGTEQKCQIKNKKKLSLCYRTPFGNDRKNRAFSKNLIALHMSRIVKAPLIGKYAVQSTSWKHTDEQRGARVDNRQHNRGSATLEAVCVMPILIAAFWMFYSMMQIFIMENHIYQAVNNTADAIAEVSYLQRELQADSSLLEWGETLLQLRSFLGEDSGIERYVVGGKSGILLDGAPVIDEEGFVCIRVRYFVRIQAPILRDLWIPMNAQIRQKAYLGYTESEEMQGQKYVYVTEHSTVYHLTRSCSHLKLTIYPVAAASLNSQYPELRRCEYCGEKEADIYYVTKTGDCYHSLRQCSGLKRTVRRVLRRQVPEYAPCSRCGS